MRFFLSDLHLADETPAISRRFFSFLRGPARHASHIDILGDLFEYWIGDDDLATPFHQEVVQALHELSAGGCRIGLMAGNRDFLMGTSLAAACHATLLAEPTQIETDHNSLLLIHGDALCTLDAAYQAFRTQVRSPGWQQQFLAKPIVERRAIATALREQSRTEKRGKPSDQMDVQEKAITALLREHHYPTLIHGHTHRPGDHVHIVDGRHCLRFVLADWHAEGGEALALDGGHWQRVRT